MEYNEDLIFSEFLDFATKNSNVCFGLPKAHHKPFYVYVCDENEPSKILLQNIKTL